ncbi:MAG: hypothetical protein K0U98_25295 [Deltaproteobacteria bacterium]|nr:hypothetical protein [Deltaproteobacteria bacterium]
MLSTCMDIQSKERSRLKRRLTLWLVFVLTLVATGAWSELERPSSSSSPFGSGGPWAAVSNVPECSSLGRVCAEWPFHLGGQRFLAVCCIQPSDLGSTKPPESACSTGNLVVRRDVTAGEDW